MSETMILPDITFEEAEHEVWTYLGYVVCVGDERVAIKVRDKMRADRLDRVKHRLPIWC